MVYLTLIIGLLVGYLVRAEVDDYKTKRSFERVLQSSIKKKKENV